MLIDHTLSSYVTSASAIYPAQAESDSIIPLSWRTGQKSWLVFAAAVFLVSVPVFIEAPLVRAVPLLSLVMSLGWVALSFVLMSKTATQLWGDLLLGFSWSWLAGSIYWGWLRWEPLLHLPVEAICLPFALVCLKRGWGKVGSLFYLGSLFGTVLTDIYFYLVDLIPHWRQLMQVEPALASPILQGALLQVQTPWGQCWAATLALILITFGIFPLRYQQLHWWAFSGAVLSTILVDSLFWLAATTM